MNLDELERMLRHLQEGLGRTNLRPTKIIIQPANFRRALVILGRIKHPVRKASGARARKLALCWRKTLRHSQP